jgi:hypothetical protein
MNVLADCRRALTIAQVPTSPHPQKTSADCKIPSSKHYVVVAKAKHYPRPFCKILVAKYCLVNIICI